MLKDFLILFFECFFISLLATIYQNYKLQNKEEAKAKWTKFWVYIVIITLVSSVLYYNNFFIKIIFLTLLSFRSVYELWLIRNSLANKFVLLIPILIIIVSSLEILYLDKNVSLWIYATLFIFDGFSQIGGQLVKSPKITPTISNGKTLAGLIIGSSIALLAYLQLFIKNNVHSDIFFNSLCFILIIVGCFFGDLGASFIKRKVGIKDFNIILPGHGGVLDRFDSFYGCYFMYFIFQVVQFLINKYVV